jgi:hypothetical protein
VQQNRHEKCDTLTRLTTITDERSVTTDVRGFRYGAFWINFIHKMI